jgi:hypothetical protein
MGSTSEAYPPTAHKQNPAGSGYVRCCLILVLCSIFFQHSNILYNIYIYNDTILRIATRLNTLIPDYRVCSALATQTPPRLRAFGAAGAGAGAGAAAGSAVSGFGS